ncbi:type II toxin-antitoxin system prevent-host-death family antitoxin [Iamia sp.]|uniref:type II toxin-antitoxin system Phd/YefM family antitoxin n=1 Tax=Iamia sp. TaxID=2722710 RepID=UPI002BD02D10|nr:type II toxin-antitoxin system prevent-host-death family antitoxin [Iamia sp.]HXH56969.1 type II toxin-antitoxin system prevent-host-death family antitoxin [Iamia sp.]
MVIQMNVSEAKAKLSELLDAAESGDEVVIARSGRAVARLVAISEPSPRTLGFLPVSVADELFAPLADGERADWE